MSPILYVFLGGGAGAACRFLVGSALACQIEQGKFPFGVLVCNIVGCFLIGLFYNYASQSAPQWFSPLIITGFLGGFTTFSSFGLESIRMINANAYLHLSLYLAITVIGGLAAVMFALKIIK
ncbi:fluoride efflux transporter CrcB [Akkermansiaceae bacterium]|nr:fluoride efflux transporter CrcB [Akkermansiaceae bacterium]